MTQTPIGIVPGGPYEKMDFHFMSYIFNGVNRKK